MLPKYPKADFTYDPDALAGWMSTHSTEAQERVLAGIRWLVQNGDRAGALSYPPLSGQ